MQFLRVLQPKRRVRLTKCAASNMASICATQLRDHATDSLAEGTIPAALDLPSAHTSRDVCIVGAVRTPFGAFQGSLAPLSATHLGSLAIKASLERAGLHPSHVQEVIMGNVISAGLGQAPARQAALGAGLPPTTVCSTVNKVCASGMKAVMLAAQSIQTGTHDIVIAGGMESMSNEVTPVQVPGKQGAMPTPVMTDEALLKVKPDKLRSLPPAFVMEGGTVTAGNSSIIADGAAALVLVSAERASELGLRVLAHIRGYADAAQEPQDFSTSPALAVPIALARARMQQQDVDYWEINQAFSVVDLVNQQLLGLSPDRVNVHGGATALGHPIGASGAAIIVRLLSVLDRHNGKSGVATICNGGGGASAIVLQRTYTAAEGSKTTASCGRHEGSSSSGL
ncbi:MAG: putative acetyl- cytosolic 2-like [Trebouxia sp. A1-2]|nr:MAG: putative acetyl- cytosolic 2-like [Trebouxia sp. A1-2]